MNHTTISILPEVKELGKKGAKHRGIKTFSGYVAYLITQDAHMIQDAKMERIRK